MQDGCGVTRWTYVRPQSALASEATRPIAATLQDRPGHHRGSGDDLCDNDTLTDTIPHRLPQQRRLQAYSLYQIAVNSG